VLVVGVPLDPQPVGEEGRRRWRHWDPESAEVQEGRGRFWLPRWQSKAQVRGRTLHCLHWSYGGHLQSARWLGEWIVGSQLRRLRR
jgi:hypothetical protein